MSIILFIAILVLLILVHELGHFVAAKISGVRVDEFAIGFPPRLFSVQHGETRYSLGLVPFGGYVSIYGEDGDDDDPRSFARQKHVVQIFILVAGVCMNLLLGWALIATGLMGGLPVSESAVSSETVLQNPRLVVVQVLGGSAAESAGLRAGDTIVEVVGGDESLLDPSVSNLQEFIASRPNQELIFSISREEESLDIPVLVRAEGSVGRVGIGLDRVGTLQLGPLAALQQSVPMAIRITTATAVAIGGFISSLFTADEALSQVTGPVGLVGVVGAASELGVTYVLMLVVIISINLAIINILPFPALDGGRVLMVLIEWISRRRIPVHIAGWLNVLGFGLLILLMVVITVADLSSLVG